MVLLDYLRQLYRPVGVRHPMEVDREDVRIQLPDPLLGVEPLALEHLHGDVDDAGPEAGGLQMGEDNV